MIDRSYEVEFPSTRWSMYDWGWNGDLVVAVTVVIVEGGINWSARPTSPRANRWGYWSPRHYVHSGRTKPSSIGILRIRVGFTGEGVIVKSGTVTA